MSDALLLVAHGTRSEAGAAECRDLAERVREARPGVPVEIGNLELAEPSIGDGLDRLVADGARRVVAVPLLLFRARHAKRDIPEALDAQRRRHPGLDVRYGAPLGVRADLCDLAAARVAEVTPASATAETAVVLARAGSTDPDAADDIAAVARLLASREPYRAVWPAFAGIAEPSVDAALERCCADGARRLVVVPYLLFTGHLADRVRGRAEALAAARPEATVMAAPHLGPDPQVARLLWQRYDEAALRRPWRRARPAGSARPSGG